MLYDFFPICSLMSILVFEKHNNNLEFENIFCKGPINIINNFCLMGFSKTALSQGFMEL